MAMSPQMQEQYEECRLRMNKLNADFRKYMWIMIALGALIFLSSFMAGAASTLQTNKEGPWIFYEAMSTGIFQILLGLATIVCGWLASAKLRAPSLMIAGVYLIGMVAIMFQQNGTFAAANIFFLLTGLGVNIWVQRLFGENEELKTQPGYPMFSVEADTRAHYEVPPHIAARRAAASEHMDTVGTPAPVPVQTAAPAPHLPEPAAETAEPRIFSDPKPLGPTPSVRLPAEVDHSGPFDLNSTLTAFEPSVQPETVPEPVPVPQVTLEAFTNQNAAQKSDLPPQMNAADMLVDMRSIPSHATVQGNPDLLPTPEDVRARLAAMKKARAEHPPEDA